MRVLILNGSPKKRFGASHLLISTLRVMLAGCKTDVQTLAQRGRHAELAGALDDYDALVIVSPLYVDAAPSHVLSFLTAAELSRRGHKKPLTLYAVSNSGFIEGRQNRTHLDIYRCWCSRTGVRWGGGVGIGGGVMYLVLALLLAVRLIIFLASAIIFTVQNLAAAPFSYFTAPGISLLIWLFLNSGILVMLGALAATVRRGGAAKNRYTRVMVPSFVFLIMADIYMLVMFVFKGGLFRTLFRRKKSR